MNAAASASARAHAVPSSLTLVWAITRFLFQYFSALKWMFLISAPLMLVGFAVAKFYPAPPVIAVLIPLMILPPATLIMGLIFGVPAGIRTFAGSTRSATLPGLQKAVFWTSVAFTLLSTLLISAAIALRSVEHAMLMFVPMFLLLSVHDALTHLFVKPHSAIISRLVMVYVTIRVAGAIGTGKETLWQLQLPALALSAASLLLFNAWLQRQRRFSRVKTANAHSDSILSVFRNHTSGVPGKPVSYNVPTLFLLRGSSDTWGFRACEALALVFGFPLGMMLFLATVTFFDSGESKLTALTNSPLPVLFLMFPFAMQGFLLQARVRNLRKLWLKIGADRRQLFRLLETQTLFDVAMLVLAVLAYLGVCALAGVPSLPDPWTALLYWFAVTLSPLYLVMALLARGLSPLQATLLQMLPMAAAMTILLSTIFSGHETPAMAMAAGLLVLLPLCRAFAQRSWQQVDFHRLRPARIFR